jgi:hypothetical protein
MQPPGTQVRRERELTEQLLARRAAQELAAARIEPPAYIVKELGERPTEPAKARVWDQGVREIEGYRLEHGVTDTVRVFGLRSRGSAWSGGTQSEGLPITSAGLSLSIGGRFGNQGSSWISGDQGSSAPTRAIEAPRSRWSTPAGSDASRP